MSEGENGPADAEEGSVLSPDELDISDDQRVVELDDGRYVISSEEGGPPGAVERESVEATPDEPGSTDVGGEPESPTTPDETGRAADEVRSPREREPATPRDGLGADEVHRWLEAHVDAAGSKYGFDITATFEGSVDRRELFSNDVVTTFESLLLWYARHVGDDTPVEEVLGILLAEASTGVKYPASTVETLAARHGLSGDDSIEDLVAALDRDDGFFFPP